MSPERDLAADQRRAWLHKLTRQVAKRQRRHVRRCERDSQMAAAYVAEMEASLHGFYESASARSGIRPRKPHLTLSDVFHVFKTVAPRSRPRDSRGSSQRRRGSRRCMTTRDGPGADDPHLEPPLWRHPRWGTYSSNLIKLLIEVGA